MSTRLIAAKQECFAETSNAETFAIETICIQAFLKLAVISSFVTNAYEVRIEISAKLC